MARLGRGQPFPPHLGKFVATTPVTGTAALAPAAFTLAASGTESFSGTAALAPGAFTLSASGVQYTATAALAPGAFVLAAAGTVTVPTFTGTVALVPGAFVLAATGIPPGAATGALVPAAFALAAAATVSGPPAPTATQIANALAGRYGPVSLRFRYEQRDRANTFIADVTTSVIDCTIALDNDQAVSRTAQFTLNPATLPASLVVTTQGQYGIAVFCDVLVNAAYTALQLGLFHLDVPTKTYSPNHQALWQVTASEMTMVLATRQTTTPYTVPIGSNYLATVAALCTSLGLAQSLPSGSQTTPVDLTWPPATPYIQIVNDLLYGINYYPVWADATGSLTSRLRLDPWTETPAVVYSTESEPRMVAGVFVESTDTTKGPNQVIVAIDDPLRAPDQAVRTNVDATSVISTTTLGQTVLLQVTGGAQPSSKAVADTPTAGAIAAFELREAATRSLPGTLQTLLDPRRTNREFYQLTIESIENTTQWRVASWQMHCKEGDPMSHTLGKALPVAVT